MTDQQKLGDNASAAVVGTATLAAYRRTLLGRLDQRFFSSRLAWVIAGILLIVILVWPSVQFVEDIQEVERTLWRGEGQKQRTALGRWLPTAALLTEPQLKEDPYGIGHWFPTPPLVLICLAPLSKLSYAAAGVVWAGLKICGFLLAMFLLIRELGRRDLHVPLGVLLATALYALRQIAGDLKHGNLNVFVVVWLGIGWVLFMRGRDFWAGLFVALAVVTKVTPVLALPYFLYKRAWRVCLGIAVGLVLVFIVIPGLHVGFGQNLTLLQSWYEMLVAPYALHGYAPVEIPNQSLYGVLLRLLSNVGWLSIQEMPCQDALEAGMPTMARPATMLGRLMRPAIGLLVIGFLAWTCRSRTTSRRDPRLLIEFAAVLLAMLLLSERTWKHHATTLPIVYLAVWYALTCIDWPQRFRSWFVAGLAAQLVLLHGTSEDLVGEHLAELLLDGGFFCWGLAFCLFQTGILLRALNARAMVPDGLRPTSVAGLVFTLEKGRDIGPP